MITSEGVFNKTEKIAVVGLGYVGLPLAIHLAGHFNVVGYDLKTERIRELASGYDRTLEVTREALASATVVFTDDPTELSACRFIIVAVPTPIDVYRIPDLSPLRGASRIVGRHMSAGSCVVFESTVYPGATEEVCVPILEEESGLVFGRDFTVGYSPERINPGDREHTFDKILKIVSGSDEATLHLLTQIYGRVVKAGLHQASSIKVAEAAKVIENTQRDLNIALMNELAMIFDKMHIDTTEVLEAAGTKWNFLPFKPGLVGGHCIGVDPYYLTFKAESIGYHPDMILAGRRINDGMGKFVAERTVKMLIKTGKPIRGAKIAVLGLTFKEDVPDLRNTRVVDIVSELRDYGIEVGIHDPMADPDEALRYYGLDLVSLEDLSGVDGVILAVMHRTYREMGLARIAALCGGRRPLVVDIKSAFSVSDAMAQGIEYWRL
ncbi:MULTISPECIES: nucleotide sugar dehydrogenase [Desulfococcus]|uniref:Nucleotide sugar dehydrogenase n=1 Tax=Desulfococcus multivorans DSM 2059 TaxID=1121405 RepID=S7TPZ7_DESML|nr:nucleotide sugar dehydrogenase [Desulfococcus multivorans]AOY57953.1 WecC: UDP-N-acetyl-D-mannosamine dehydrogenase [Desulfococcus multivorans]AQV00323.1 GDP-mannose dehydrogenase [Desulfococcus multivorans]EPR39036.1 nucleotide sugar dehydrogenase [Desulfococcus multivorans DSM 2059]SJZ64604.1 UDP-N-acetyl-D-galactosamine dehydrogenase [Desulfococcus multivorans DSM 2059]